MDAEDRAVNVGALVPEFELFEESTVAGIAWHSTAIGRDGRALGSGLAPGRMMARQIALAESIERAVVRRLRSENPEGWQLTRHPSTCGFAVGRSQESARQRAIWEAVERWAWEQWIERGAEIPEAPLAGIGLSHLAKALLEPFDIVRCFRVAIAPFLNDGVADDGLALGILVAFKDGGAFVGSRVAPRGADLWTHAAVESRRCLLVASLPEDPMVAQDVIEARVRHHARDASAALAALSLPRKSRPLVPRLAFTRDVEGLPDGWHASRAICAGLRGWHEGDETRFVY